MENIIFQTTTKTGKGITFRYPTIKDTKIFKNYINKISAEKTFILMQGVQKTLKEEKAWINNFLKNKDKIVIIGAFIENKLIGVSDISLGYGAKIHIGDFGITIAKEFRGEGIGKKLMELVIQKSIENIEGLKIITLEVFANNPIALPLYKKLGFKEYGSLPNGLKRLSKYSDSILMYKLVK